MRKGRKKEPEMTAEEIMKVLEERPDVRELMTEAVKLVNRRESKAISALTEILIQIRIKDEAADQ